MRKISYMAALILTALIFGGCTEVRTMKLNLSYENVTEENLTYVSDTDSSLPGLVENVTEEVYNETDTPLAVGEQAYVYVDPDNLVKKLCPEQVLLGLRGCKDIDGTLNISIKNAGFRNVTMIFYLLYHDEIMGYVYKEKPFLTKTERTFTINLDELEQQYGEITKIEATPVLVQGMEQIACQNKKLPVIVSGCS